MKWIGNLRERFPHQSFDADDPYRMQEFQRERAARWKLWTSAVGARYANCTFDSFVVTTDAMAQAVADCREYADRLAARDSSANLVIFGACGSGKDHLAIAVCRSLFERDWKLPEPDNAYESTGWPRGSRGVMAIVTGAQLMVRVRDAMKAGREEQTLRDYVTPALLVLSDPAASSGDALTGYQSSTLADVIDGRYRADRPTVLTINCRDREEMNRLLTVPLADRLCHDAVCVACDWPSYRKRTEVNATQEH